MFDEVLKSLGVEKLNEEQQDQIRQKIQDVVDLQVKDKVDQLVTEKMEEEKANLVESFQERYGKYKQDTLSKFSNFVDTVMETELEIPDQIREYASKGRLYNDLIEEFKTRLAIDEGLLDEEVRELLEEAKQTILDLQERMDEEIGARLIAESDAREFALEIYKYQKCDGLKSAQRQRAMSLLEDVETVAAIDRKFDLIFKNILKEEDPVDEDDEDVTDLDMDDMDVEEKDEDVNVNEDIMQSYVKILKENKF